MHIIYLHEALPVESDIISDVKFTKGPAMRVVCEHIVQYFTILKTGWTHLTCTQSAFRICETPEQIDEMIAKAMLALAVFGAEAE